MIDQLRAQPGKQHAVRTHNHLRIGQMCQDVVWLAPRYVISRFWGPVYQENLARQLVPLCDDETCILDFGCDDGAIAQRMMERNPTLSIVGVDVQAQTSAHIPKAVYDGRRLPYADATFDTVLVIDVLHHTEDIPALLSEINRVTKYSIIIKDHAYYSIWSKMVHSAFDYITNEPFGIACVYNFATPQQWQQYFAQLDVDVIDQPELHVGLGINARYNPVFKLQKRART